MNDQDISSWTDKYFTRTKEIVVKYGDVRVTYAVFIRRPVLMACDLALNFIEETANAHSFSCDIQRNYDQGEEVGAGDPLFYLTGSLQNLSELETLILQKTGAPCVAAMNARDMCLSLPEVDFLAMDARHCTGADMSVAMAYAASVGSQAAKAQGAHGFIGNATDATAHFFGQQQGFGTMPHALVGYAGSTVKAAEMFHETHPDVPLTVLVDYFGKECSDALGVCRTFPELSSSGRLAVRLDTNGSRYLEGLTPQKSYEVLERNAPEAIRGYRGEDEIKHLVGTGVSAAAIWHMRNVLDDAGYTKVKIVASSGFAPAKCRVMSFANAPIDIVGTGSYLPSKAWSETYATADIICYDGEFKVKTGREYLIKDYKLRYGEAQK